jgi:hypothetical protein
MMKNVRDSKMFSFKYMMQMITQEVEYERVKNELGEKVTAGVRIIQGYSK